MEMVKAVLSTAMFVVTIYFLRFTGDGLSELLRLIPGGLVIGGALVAVGVAALIVYLKFGETKLGKGLRLGAVGGLTVGFVLMFFGAGGLEGGGQPTGDGFAGIAWIESHDSGIARAREKNRPVMIDFTADWCQACKELDRMTYVDEAVQKEAKRFVNLKIDATDMTEEMDTLFELYSIHGLPTVVFIDSTGATLEDPRVTGFVPPERFLTLMTKVQ